MDFLVKHQDYFSFPSYRLVTSVNCSQIKCGGGGGGGESQVTV